jgi:hypothetical protein
MNSTATNERDWKFTQSCWLMQSGKSREKHSALSIQPNKKTFRRYADFPPQGGIFCVRDRSRPLRFSVSFCCLKQRCGRRDFSKCGSGTGRAFWRTKYIDENPVKAGLSKAPKNIRIARPISGRRKNPAAKAGFLEHLTGPAEARALIRTRIHVYHAMGISHPSTRRLAGCPRVHGSCS